MAKEQAKEWAAAQNITVSIDLVEAAKTHLKFLDAVEHRNRLLFEDQVLKRAVYRYNAFWLPLLAKHEENPISEESLVVPLDCELIWHCHRLNPVRYNFDCEKLFGRILTNRKVRSSLETASKRTTEEIWSKMYPEEPYELDLEKPFSKESLQKNSRTIRFTRYDLIAAVKRQMGFTYQACRPHMSDELFLREAESRYKGFLYLVQTNKKTGSDLLCVPTYDVDLMWHTHQLYPDAYCKDMKELVGSVVQHNDSDPDKSKGSKLDTGFTETTMQWEKTFGFSYWKAGAMNKGDIPTPVTRVPYKFNSETKELKKSEEIAQGIHFPTMKSVEVLLEFVDIKNLPEQRKENLVVAFSKKQTDTLFKTKRCVGISSASKDKLFALFECEPRGEFLFELFSCSPTSDELKPSRSFKLLGSCSFSFDELLASGTQLWTNKWVSLDLVTGLGNSEPVLLNVSMSFSPPMPAPQVFQLWNCQRVQNDLIQTHVVDSTGKTVLNLQKRSITTKDETKHPSDSLTEVYYITGSGEKETLVERHGSYWSVKGTNELFTLRNSSKDDGDSLYELAGYNKIVKLLPGRRLLSETKRSRNEKSEQDFTTIVKFSTDYPYGKAVGLINSKSRTITVMDQTIVLPSIVLAFILPNNLTRDEQTDFSIDRAIGAPCSIDAKGTPCSIDAKGTPCSIDAKGTPCSIDAMGTPCSIDAIGTPCSIDAKGTPCSIDAKGTPCSIDAIGTPCSIDAKGTPCSIDGKETVSAQYNGAICIGPCAPYSIATKQEENGSNCLVPCTSCNYMKMENAMVNDNGSNCLVPCTSCNHMKMENAQCLVPCTSCTCTLCSGEMENAMVSDMEMVKGGPCVCGHWDVEDSLPKEIEKNGYGVECDLGIHDSVVVAIGA